MRVRGWSWNDHAGKLGEGKGREGKMRGERRWVWDIDLSIDLSDRQAGRDEQRFNVGPIYIYIYIGNLAYMHLPAGAAVQRKWHITLFIYLYKAAISLCCSSKKSRRSENSYKLWKERTGIIYMRGIGRSRRFQRPAGRWAAALAMHGGLWIPHPVNVNGRIHIYIYNRITIFEFPRALHKTYVWSLYDLL